MKICKAENCSYRVFSKGFCKSHWQREFGKPIRKISVKHQKTLDEYRIIRDDFMQRNPICQAKLKGCTKDATDCHHRIGKNSKEDWLNSENFMSLCRNCHNKIEDGGEWVYEQGFKIKRI